jgi:DNA-binding MarR family transcriptional regulator
MTFAVTPRGPMSADRPTLDLLSVLRRAGPPYQLTTREIGQRALVTAGAVSQRLTRAQRTGLVQRAVVGDGSRSVLVTLTPAGHALVEQTVDQVLGREPYLVDGLSAVERASLAGLLDRLLADVVGRLNTQPDEPRAPGSNADVG